MTSRARVKQSCLKINHTLLEMICSNTPRWQKSLWHTAGLRAALEQVQVSPDSVSRLHEAHVARATQLVLFINVPTRRHIVWFNLKIFWGQWEPMFLCKEIYMWFIKLWKQFVICHVSQVKFIIVFMHYREICSHTVYNVRLTNVGLHKFGPWDLQPCWFSSHPFISLWLTAQTRSRWPAVDSAGMGTPRTRYR